MGVFCAPEACFIYEHPLNERIRLLMRLEALFLQMKTFHQASEYYTIQLFLDALFDVLDFLHRYEIRSELIKELQNYKTSIERGGFMLEREANVRLETMKQIDHSIHEIHHLGLQMLSVLRENDLLNSLRQRNFNQSGNCLFEVPAFQYWLNQSYGQESAFLVEVYQYFVPIIQAIELILRLVREEAECEMVMSEDGMLLRNLESKKRNQMIRIHLPKSLQAFPRISGDRHRVAIRLMAQPLLSERAKQIEGITEFHLQICAL